MYLTPTTGKNTDGIIMSIQSVIERARSEPPHEPPDSPLPGAFECSVVDPVQWDKAEAERALRTEIPAELEELWRGCGGMSLYRDTTYGQWGLVVLSPKDALSAHTEYLQNSPEWVLPGDVVFARFRGDLELALLRCDRNAPDYGRVMIVAEMDERSLWRTAADSLEEFLTRFMDTKGDKYWEFHYEAMKVEREARIKAREPLRRGQILTDEEIECALEARFSAGFIKRTNDPLRLGWIVVSKHKASVNLLKESEGDESPLEHVQLERRLRGAPYLVRTMEIDKGKSQDDAETDRRWFRNLAEVKAYLGTLGYRLEEAKDACDLGAPLG